MSKKHVYGLIGFPLSHSFSPTYFNNKFEREKTNAVYKLFPLELIQDFPSLINAQPDLAGLNVTIPHKEKVIPFLDELSPEAAAIGAVNTIVFKNQKLIGHNTDAAAFENSLLSLKSTAKKALIFGTGGASKAVQYVLNKHDVSFQLIGRMAKSNSISYSDLSSELAKESALWINCTPVGMSPKVNQNLDLPFSILTKNHTVIDLIYNPEETRLLKIAKGFGAKTLNGLEMLHNQAQKAWELWHA